MRDAGGESIRYCQLPMVALSSRCHSVGRPLFTLRRRFIKKEFYAAVIKRDLAAARRYLKDDLVFVGLFETYRGADRYLAALKGLLGVTDRLEIKQGNEMLGGNTYIIRSTHTKR